MLILDFSILFYVHSFALPLSATTIPSMPMSRIIIDNPTPAPSPPGNKSCPHLIHPNTSLTLQATQKRLPTHLTTPQIPSYPLPRLDPTKQPHRSQNMSSGAYGGGYQAQQTGGGQDSSAAQVDNTARTVHYKCGDCDQDVPLKRGEPIRCRNCGHRVLYKQRTNR